MPQNTYFLLFSHTMVIVPIGICFWKYKTSRDYQALLLALQLLYTACFSVVFHTYDYNNVTQGFDPEQKNYDVWKFLDYLCSRSVLFTNIAYTGRFKTESFYFVTHLAMIIFMLLELKAPNDVTTFITILMCVLVTILKIKTLGLYFYYYWKHTFFSFFLFGSALYCLFEASHYDYHLFHSFWHILIFSTSASACILKHRLDTIRPLEVEPIIYNRPPSDSL
jgi:hypothetical protein